MNAFEKYATFFITAAAASLVGLIIGFSMPHKDGLVAVKSMSYTNTYPEQGFNIICKSRGTRSNFNPDGSDITVGDRLVRDCVVVAR